MKIAINPGLLSLGIWLAAEWVAFGQSTDSLVLQGRNYLAIRNLTNANSLFHAAVVQSPKHQTANALYAITRLLSLPYQPAEQDMMDRVGLSLTNRDLYQWNAQVPTDTNGIPVPSNDFDAMEAVAFVRTNVIPEIAGALANLSIVVDTNFILLLTSNETTFAEVIIDYGDIQMLRALLFTSEFEGYTVNAYNLSVQLNALYNLYQRRRDVTVERLLINYPLAFTVATTNDFSAAKGAFENAVQSYLTASEFIRNRPTNITRLFNYDRQMTTSEAQFRQTLVELRASLLSRVMLTEITNRTHRVEAHLGNYFENPRPLRDYLPAIQGNQAVVGSLPDPTFGGVIFGVDASDIYSVLGRGLTLLPQFHLALRLMDGSFELEADAVDGRHYSVQASPDLLNWQEVTNGFATNGLLTFRDLSSAKPTERFYRIEDVSRFVSFEGQVVAADTLQAISGALISSSIDNHTCVSDSAGHYFLQTGKLCQSIGSYQIMISAKGYTTAKMQGYCTGELHLSGLKAELAH